MSSPGYFFTPEDQEARDALLRKQAFAQALLKQGSSDPGNAAYGGLRNAGNSIIGAFLANRTNDAEKGLAKSAQDKYTQALGSFLTGSNATPQAQSAPPSQVSNSPIMGMGGQVHSAPSPQAGNNPMVSNSPSPATSGQPQVGAVNAPATVQGNDYLNRLMATGNPALINQFAPQLFENQLNRDNKVWENQQPLSVAKQQESGLELQKQEALAKFNNGLPLTAAEKATLGIQQGQLAVSRGQLAVAANQPHFVPYGTGSYIQNGKLIPVPGGGASTSPFGTGDPKATSLQGQLGLSTAGLNYLMGNTSSLGPRDKQMAAKEVDQFVARTGLDQSTLKAKAGAYNSALTMNTLKANTMDTLNRELQGTIQNFAPIADQINPGNIRFVNGIAQVIGSQANSPAAQQYVTYLNQMRADLAGFNAVSGGKIGMHGQVQTDNADFQAAEHVIQNGLSSGGARGLAQAIEATRQKNTAIVEHQSNEAQRGIWNALGIGANFDAVHPHAQAAAPAQNQPSAIPQGWTVRQK